MTCRPPGSITRETEPQKRRFSRVIWRRQRHRRPRAALRQFAGTLLTGRPLTVGEPNVADEPTATPHRRHAIARIGVRTAASRRLLAHHGDAEALLRVDEVVAVVGARVKLDPMDLAGDGPTSIT